jgi:hypothetical protein
VVAAIAAARDETIGFRKVWRCMVNLQIRFEGDSAGVAAKARTEPMACIVGNPA